MQRTSVVALALSAALAIGRLVVPAAPSASGRGSGAAFQAKSSAPSGAAAAGGGLTRECTAYEPEEDSSRAFPNPHDENFGAAQRVLKAFFDSNTAPGPVRYAIALAPDPRHTNLSLMFDREISVVEQAAQDEGYEYNSSWMPWAAEARPPLDALGDRQYAARITEAREECPGVMLFRKSSTRMTFLEASQKKHPSPKSDPYPTALVVFVVGEQATGGINEGQWNTTVRLLEHRTTDDKILRILGPTFTGSLVSLQKHLAQMYGSDKAIQTNFPDARIFSGSVGSCSGARYFQQQLAQTNKSIDFGSFEENDSLQIFRFLEYMHGQGTDPSDVAILSEDETAYAALRLSDKLPNKATDSIPDHDPCDFPYARDNRPLHLVYPRDISAIRDAYQKQSVFDSSGNSVKEGAHPILRDSTGEEPSNTDVTDTVPAFSGSVSALAQEAYLFGVVSFLRAHHSKFLILRCTNPLDSLFLTRFFHRAYPQARIVILGTDLLFGREIDTTEFRGVLALTNYPLLTFEQHWSRITDDDSEKSPHNHLVFESHLQEGAYLAARYLLQPKLLAGDLPLAVEHPPDAPPLILRRAVPTADYADPFWLWSPGNPPVVTHPPVWLVSLGRDGYWPLAVLNHDLGQHLGNKTADEVTPPSTMVQLAMPQGSVLPAEGQHYELAIDAGDKTKSAKQPKYDNKLLIDLPLPWLVATILAGILAVYQIFGMMGKKHVSNGLFSVFQKVSDPSQLLLQGLNCALAVLPLIELVAVGSIPPRLDLVSGSVHELWWYKFFTSLLCLGLLAAIFWRWVKYKIEPVPATGSGQTAPARRIRFKIDWRRGVGCAACYVGFFLVGLHLDTYAFQMRQNDAGLVSLFYRSAHLTDGVSPLLPCLLLTLGFYLWTWQALAGNLMLTRGCPTLPEIEELTPRPAGRWRAMYNNLIGYQEQPTTKGGHLLPPSASRISQALSREIMKVASPLCLSPRIVAAPCLFLIAAVLCYWPNHLPLLSLEGITFNRVLNLVMVVALLMTAAEAARLYFTWVSLRKLLHGISRLRLRRTFAHLRPLDANSIWSVSGNVRRFQYRLFVQQLDALHRLITLTGYAPPLWERAQQYGKEFTLRAERMGCWSKNGAPRDLGARWEKSFAPDGLPKLAMRNVLSDAVADVYRRLEVEWEVETVSLTLELHNKPSGDETDVCRLPLSRHAAIRAAEEFVAFHYMVFIQNIVARMRTIALSMVILFVTVCFAIAFYPFVPRTEIAVWMVINLTLIGSTVAYVYAAIERNEILSYMANTNPGKLGTEFWVKMASFLAAPVIGILTTQFPSITDTVLHWLQPGLDAIK